MDDYGSEWSNPSRRQSVPSSPTDILGLLISSPTKEASTSADVTFDSSNQGENESLVFEVFFDDDADTLVHSRDGRKSWDPTTADDISVENHQSTQLPDVEIAAASSSASSVHPRTQQPYLTPFQTHAPRFNPPRPLPRTPDSVLRADHVDRPQNVILTAYQNNDGHDAPTLASPPSPTSEPTDLQTNWLSPPGSTQNSDVQEPPLSHPHISTAAPTLLSTPPHSPPPSPPPQDPSSQPTHPPQSFPEEHGSLWTHLDPQTNSDYIQFSLGEDQWRQYTHPNGSLYWTCPSRRVVMDDIPGPGTIHTLHTLIAQLENMDDIDQWELYVSTKSRHFIHHGSRSASKDSGLPELFDQVNQARSNIQSKLELESRYWTFVQAHPNHVTIPEDADHDAEDAILWCYADRRLFDSSHAPFEKDTAQEMFSILQILSSRSRITLKTWFVAAILRSVVQERIASRYGTENARDYRQLEKAEEVPDFPPLSSSWHIFLWKVAAFMAFGAPFSYLKRIINVDRSNGISTMRWQAFLKSLCAEWTDSNLLSVVLVSGTIAMLSIQGLTGMAQMAAFYSSLCALSAALTGMLLISSHRGRVESNGRAAFLYFNNAKRMMGSPHVLAIILSLPLALTFWGMLWFTISVVSSAYFANLPITNTNYKYALRFTSICIVCALVGVVALVAWFFRAQRGSGALRRRLHGRRSTLPPTKHHATPSPSEARGRRHGIQMIRMSSSSPSVLLDCCSAVGGDVYHPHSVSPLDFGCMPSPHSLGRQDTDAELGEGAGSSPNGFPTTPVSGAIYHPPATTHGHFTSATSSIARAVYHPTSVYGPHDVEPRATRVPYRPRRNSVPLPSVLPPVIPTSYYPPSLPPSHSSANTTSPPTFLPPTAVRVPDGAVIPVLSHPDVPASFSPGPFPFAYQTRTSLRFPSMTVMPKDQPPNSFADDLYPPRIVLRSNEPYGSRLGTPTYRPSPLGPNRQALRMPPTPRPVPAPLPHYPPAAASQVGRSQI